MEKLDDKAHALCHVICRYPTELKLLVVYLFILAPLGTAFCLLMLQGWDTSW